eukprot:3940693-Amphidinium_carterae.1
MPPEGGSKLSLGSGLVVLHGLYRNLFRSYGRAHEQNGHANACSLNWGAMSCLQLHRIVAWQGDPAFTKA